MWKREVRQHLAPWQARLDALAPLEGLEGLPLELMGEEAAGGDPEGETEARNRIEQLTALEARLEKLEASLLEALRAQRRVAASGALPALEGLDFALEAVREDPHGVLEPPELPAQVGLLLGEARLLTALLVLRRGRGLPGRDREHG